MKPKLFLIPVIAIIGIIIFTTNQYKSSCPDFESIANSTLDLMEGNFQITKTDGKFTKSRSLYMHGKPHSELIELFEDEGEEELAEVGFESKDGGFTKNGDFYRVEIVEAPENSSIVTITCKH